MNNQVNTLTQDDLPAFDPVFSSYKPANDILSEYRKRLKKAGVYFRAEGSEIQKTVLSDMRFREVLTNALELALEEALKDAPYRRRTIQLRSMCVQRKLFLKITYSSRRDQSEENPYFQTIQELIRDKAGYVKNENGESENMLMIALPIKG